MTASAMLLIAAMAMVSGAKRLHRKDASGDVLHPVTVPMMQQAPLVNSPVVTLQRLQAQPSSFPAVWSNQSTGIFPPSLLLAADGSATLGSTAPTSINTVQSTAPKIIDTIQSMNLDSFLGSWRQMYGSASKENPAFGNTGQISEYRMERDGNTMDVTNSYSSSGATIDGNIKLNSAPGQTALGKYVFTSLKDRAGAKLDMKPFLAEKPDLAGEYWIYKLGPIKDKKYEYAIVGEPPALTHKEQTMVSVLARNEKDFKSKYDNEVQLWLTQNGLDSPLNKPRAITKEYQSSNWMQKYLDLDAAESGEDFMDMTSFE